MKRLRLVKTRRAPGVVSRTCKKVTITTAEERDESGACELRGGDAVKQYRLAWSSPATGARGHGEWSEDKALIDDWVQEGRRKYPEMHHWIEEQEVVV